MYKVNIRKSGSRAAPVIEKPLLRAALLFLAYPALAAVGGALRFGNGGYSAVWPPAGLFLLCLLASAPRTWPVLAAAGSAADLAFRLLGGDPPGAAAIIALAGAAEAAASAAAIRLALKGAPAYRSRREFLVVAAVAGATIPLGASIKAAAAVVGGASVAFVPAWAEFAVADVMGVLLVAPTLVAWIENRDAALRSRGRLARRRAAEIAALLLLSALVAWALSRGEPRGFAYREFLVVPIVLWSALRFGTRGATLANVACAVLVLATSAAARGPGGVEPGSDVASYLSIQAYVCLVALIGAIIGEEFDDRRNGSEALAASERRYRDIFENSPLGIMHTTFDGRLVSCNRRLAELFGYASKEDLERAMEGRRVQDLLYADPSERDRRLESLRGPVNGWVAQDPRTSWVMHDNHYVRKDGSSFVGRAFFRQLATSEHGADIEGIIEDRSALFATEERLTAALAEKDTLLAELEHRVKNNLNVVASLISLGASELEEGSSKKIMVEAQTRIRSMSLIYEQLYRGRASGKVALKAYVEELSRALVETYALASGKVELELEIDDWKLDTKRAVPLGLIVNELLANALKYAFPGDGPGRIRVSLARRDGTVSLAVTDDGRGLPDCVASLEGGGMGFKIVSALTAQLGGEGRVERPPRGTRVVVSFPEAAS